MIRLGDGVEVHRLKPGGEARRVAGGHVHRAQERDHDVRVVAADALTGHESRDRTVGALAEAGGVGRAGRDELRDRRDEVVALQALELAPRLAEDLVGLAVAARTQVGDRFEVARAAARGLSVDGRLVADLESSRLAR